MSCPVLPPLPSTPPLGPTQKDPQAQTAQLTSPYFPSNTSRQYAGANPVSILPRQNTTVQFSLHKRTSSEKEWDKETEKHKGNYIARGPGRPATTTTANRRSTSTTHPHHTQRHHHPPLAQDSPRTDPDMQCGPEYYEARRKAWLTPRSASSTGNGDHPRPTLSNPRHSQDQSLSSSASSSSTTTPNVTPGGKNGVPLDQGPGPSSSMATSRPPLDPSRQRISDLLASPGAAESEEIWNRGLSVLWRGLVTGSKFKKPLPLDIVIKILYAGWIRDGTWPAGATIPPSPPLDPKALEPFPPLHPGHPGHSNTHPPLPLDFPTTTNVTTTNVMSSQPGVRSGRPVPLAAPSTSRQNSQRSISVGPGGGPGSPSGYRPAVGMTRQSPRLRQQQQHKGGGPPEVEEGEEEEEEEEEV